MSEVDPIGTWDMIWYASKALLAMVVLVPLLYYVLRVVGRRITANRSIHGNMEVLDVLPLGGGKQLLLIGLAEKALLLSVSKDGVTFLWEVPSGERLQREPRIENRASTDLRRWVEKWREKQQGDGRDEGS